MLKPVAPVAPPKVEGKPLTIRQHQIYVAFTEYFKTNGEACTMSQVARRVRLNRTTVRQHLSAIRAKGWIGDNPAFGRLTATD